MEKSITTKTWDLWENHLSYLGQKNYPNVFKESIDYYEGRQWNKGLEELQIPQVTFNIIKMIIDNKASNILSTPFATHFKNGFEDNDKIDKFNRFDNYMWNELNHDLLNRKLVNDGLIKGTFAIHYYWNEDVLGQKGLFKGSMLAEVLDPLMVAVSNPKEQDIQKQKWVIVASRMEVKKVRNLCRDKSLVEMIKPDKELDNLDKEREQESDEASALCTVLTKYFRINGNVYYQQFTMNVELNKPTPLNPLIIEKELKKNEDFENGDNEYYKIDSSGVTSQTGVIDESYDVSDEEKFYLYPIEIGQLTPSDKSVYGLSDVYSIIMAQKMLNVYFSTIYKKNLDDVFPKWVVKKGALQQEITGEPNEVIVDNSVGNGWGIQKVEGTQYSNNQLSLASTITEFTKMVANSRDVLQGDSVGANMSAIAIQSLQTQAEKPIAQQREGFMYSLKKMARIRALFYKFYYEEKDYTYDLDDNAYEEQLENNKYQTTRRTISEKFNGAEYANTSFSISVDVGRGTKFDAITAQETVNSLFLNGNIDKLDSDKLEMYINLLDDNFFPYKDTLRIIMRKQRQSEKAQLTQLSQQLQSENEQLKLQAEELQAQIEFLKQEFTKRINVANEQIKNSNGKIVNQEDMIYKLYSILGQNQGTSPKKE